MERPNPEYGAASTLRFDRWVIDACTRPLDQAWLDQQHEIGLRHNRAKKNQTDHADSVDHIPLRYLLAFTAVIITTARNYLADGERSAQQRRRDARRLHQVSNAARDGVDQGLHQ